MSMPLSDFESIYKYTCIVFDVLCWPCFCLPTTSSWWQNVAYNAGRGQTAKRHCKFAYGRGGFQLCANQRDTRHMSEMRARKH